MAHAHQSSTFTSSLTLAPVMPSPHPAPWALQLSLIQGVLHALPRFASRDFFRDHSFFLTLPSHSPENLEVKINGDVLYIFTKKCFILRFPSALIAGLVLLYCLLFAHFFLHIYWGSAICPRPHLRVKDIALIPLG